MNLKRTLEYDYSHLNNLLKNMKLKIEFPSPENNQNEILAGNIDYKLNGGLTYTYFNGIRTELDNDSIGRYDTIKYINNSNEEIAKWNNYQFDGRGNITNIDYSHKESDQSQIEMTQYDYEYDRYSRLSKASSTYVNNNTLTYDYTYDFAGNMIKRDISGTSGKEYWIEGDSLDFDLTTYSQELYSKLVDKNFILEQNYPNPFNPTTEINYQLPAVSLVDLSIYNVLGQKVSTLVSAKQQAGNYKVEWNAAGFSSGVYFYRMETDKGFVHSRKLILLK